MTARGNRGGQVPVVTRFAPSPTGRLHLGHAYSAALAERMAREAGGRILLRVEDIDRARCRPAYTEALLDDLAWLGLRFDGAPVIQSARGAAHAAALDALRAAGLLYPCVCTRAEVAAAASAPHGLPAPYPGTCRRAPPRGDDPRPVAWRLDIAAATARVGELRWRDANGGEHAADPGAAGDVVLARKDVGVAYHLAAVVDDGAAGVTLVVRGCDLLEAVPVQRLLQALLGLPAPAYHHHRLVLGADGRRLAKRTPGATLADLRAAGVDGGHLREMLGAEVLPVGFSFAAS